MKSILLNAGIRMGIIMCFIPFYTNAQTWKEVGTLNEDSYPNRSVNTRIGVNNGKASNVSMVIDKTDEPCIIYNDDENHSLVTIKKFDGKQWDAVGVPGLDDSVALSKASIAFGKGNELYVAFSDPRANFSITVKKMEAGKWIVMGQRGFTKDPGIAPAFTFSVDRSGVPWLLFLTGSGYDLRKFDGHEWIDVGLIDYSLSESDKSAFAGPSLYFASFSSIGVRLTFDKENTPCVDYLLETDPIKPTVVLKKFDGTHWKLKWSYEFDLQKEDRIRTRDLFSGFKYGADSTSVLKAYYYMKYITQGIIGPGYAIAVEKDGELFVFNPVKLIDQRPSGNRDRAEVKKYQDNNFVQIGNIGFNSGEVSGIAIAFDSHNVPYIAYSSDVGGPIFVRKLEN